MREPAGKAARRGERGLSRTAVLAGVVLLAGAAAGGWALFTRMASPARQLGYEPGKGEGTGPGAGGASAKDAPLGFARFLPEETTGFSALYHAGDVVAAIRDSRAWKRLAGTSVGRDAEKGVREALDPKPGSFITPEADDFIRLAGEAFDTEILVAAGPDCPEDCGRAGSALLRSGLLALYSSSIFQGESLPREVRARRTATSLGPWWKGIEALRLPHFLLAARVRDEARFNRLFDKVLEAVRELEKDRAGKGSPAEPGPRILSEVKVGSRTFRRLRFRAADLAREMPAPPWNETDEDRQRFRSARDRFEASVFVGFLGEHLVLAFGPDDRFLAAVAARFEAGDAAPPVARFAWLREKGGRAALAASWVEDARWEKALKDELIPPCEDALSLPSDLPPGSEFRQLAASSDVFRDAIRKARERTPWAGIEGASWRDVGVRAEVRSHFAGANRPAAPTPGLTRLVPADALAYLGQARGDVDGLVSVLVAPVRMRAEALDAALARGGVSREQRGRLTEMRATLQRAIDAAQKDLAECMRGEHLWVLGRDAPVTLAMEDERYQAPLPCLAILVAGQDPARALRAVRESVSAYAEATFQVAPIQTSRLVVGGIEAESFPLPEGITIEGMVPHMFVLGNAFVFSTSPDLSRALIARSRGEGLPMEEGKNHARMKEILRAGSWDRQFLDGEAFAASLGRTTRAVVTELERARGEPSPPSVHEALDAVLEVLGTFRAYASATTQEPGMEVLRHWFLVEDLPR